MFLVGRDGKVLRISLQIGDLQAELRKLLNYAAPLIPTQPAPVIRPGRAFCMRDVRTPPRKR